MTRRVYRSEMSQPMRALLIRAKRRPIIATRFGWRFRGDTDRVNDRTLAVLVGMKLLRSDKQRLAPVPSSHAPARMFLKSNHDQSRLYIRHCG